MHIYAYLPSYCRLYVFTKYDNHEQLHGRKEQLYESISWQYRSKSCNVDLKKCL